MNGKATVAKNTVPLPPSMRFDKHLVRQWVASANPPDDPRASRFAGYVNTAQRLGFSLQDISDVLGLDSANVKKLVELFPTAAINPSYLAGKLRKKG